MSIHDLVYNNIYCSDPDKKKWNDIAANGYEKRVIGFRAEIEFKNGLEAAGRTVLDGGWMLSNKMKERCLSNSVYFTISEDDVAKYNELYCLLGKLGFIRMFFIKYNCQKEIDLWRREDAMGINAPVLFPEYTCFEYIDSDFVDKTDGKYGLDELERLYEDKIPHKARYKLKEEVPLFITRYLSEFSKKDLIHVLANRFVFDGLLGFCKKRGIPSDIDLIVKKPDGKFVLFEVKEKDRSKNPPIGFGMDIARKADIMQISSALQSDYHYIVKEVTNQAERDFLGWWYININDFQSATEQAPVVQGGTGMATAKAQSHPTVVAPVEKFKILSSQK